jgi:hypothetical protein
MDTTPEDAHLIFDGWRDRSSPLRVQLRSSSLFFEGKGAVTHSATDSLELGGDSWRFTVPLSDATFVFSDPREIPSASIREAESAQYEFGLAVLLASGDRLVLVAFKDDSDTSGELDPEPEAERD